MYDVCQHDSANFLLDQIIIKLTEDADRQIEHSNDCQQTNQMRSKRNIFHLFLQLPML